MQYNGFRCGGFELVVDVLPGESVEEVHDRTWQMMEALGKKQFEAKLEGFLGRLKVAGQRARAK